MSYPLPLHFYPHLLHFHRNLPRLRKKRICTSRHYPQALLKWRNLGVIRTIVISESVPIITTCSSSGTSQSQKTCLSSLGIVESSILKRRMWSLNVSNCGNHLRYR